jgi:hypothetical protein
MAAAARERTDVVRIQVDPHTKLGQIPQNFLGLGYEISSVTTPGLLSAKNDAYVRLVRKLGPAGVIRIGGITADYASFSPNGPSVSSPKGSAANLANLRELASFLKATGWKLIWGLNLGTGDVDQAVSEAEAVASEVKENLLAFEIGNEPDLFNRGSSAHRPSSYGYEDWLAEYRRYKSAIRKKLPLVAFAGPDAATVTDWVTQFARDEGNDLELLTHHYYRECAGPTSTLDKLLQPDPKLSPLLAKMHAASAESHVPYRICETNSFCGGGKEGVSDTFGAALWALDFMWKLAEGGCSGVNLETGVNQIGFVSWYSPIAENSAKPEYFAMLAFANGAVGGARVAVTAEAGELNLSAYAARRGDELSVTIINKEADNHAKVTLTAGTNFEVHRVMRLTAPSLSSKDAVTFALARTEKELSVPAASAVVVSGKIKS